MQLYHKRFLFIFTTKWSCVCVWRPYQIQTSKTCFLRTNQNDSSLPFKNEPKKLYCNIARTSNDDKFFEITTFNVFGYNFNILHIAAAAAAAAAALPQYYLTEKFLNTKFIIYLYFISLFVCVFVSWVLGRLPIIAGCVIIRVWDAEPTETSKKKKTCCFILRPVFGFGDVLIFLKSSNSSTNTGNNRTINFLLVTSSERPSRVGKLKIICRRSTNTQNYSSHHAHHFICILQLKNLVGLILCSKIWFSSDFRSQFNQKRRKIILRRRKFGISARHFLMCSFVELFFWKNKKNNFKRRNKTEFHSKFRIFWKKCTGLMFAVDFFTENYSHYF